MIANLTLFHFTETTAPEQIDALQAALTAMAPRIPELRFYRAAPSLRIRPDGADFGSLAVVDDAAGIDAYLDHPLHQRIARELAAPIVASRHAVQFEIDEAGLARLRTAP